MNPKNPNPNPAKPPEDDFEPPDRPERVKVPTGGFSLGNFGRIKSTPRSEVEEASQRQDDQGPNYATQAAPTYGSGTSSLGLPISGLALSSGTSSIGLSVSRLALESSVPESTVPKYPFGGLDDVETPYKYKSANWGPPGMRYSPFHRIRDTPPTYGIPPKGPSPPAGSIGGLPGDRPHANGFNKSTIKRPPRPPALGFPNTGPIFSPSFKTSPDVSPVKDRPDNRDRVFLGFSIFSPQPSEVDSEDDNSTQGEGELDKAKDEVHNTEDKNEDHVAVNVDEMVKPSDVARGDKDKHEEVVNGDGKEKNEIEVATADDIDNNVNKVNDVVHDIDNKVKGHDMADVGEMVKPGEVAQEDRDEGVVDEAGKEQDEIGVVTMNDSDDDINDTSGVTEETNLELRSEQELSSDDDSVHRKRSRIFKTYKIKHGKARPKDEKTMLTHKERYEDAFRLKKKYLERRMTRNIGRRHERFLRRCAFWDNLSEPLDPQKYKASCYRRLSAEIGEKVVGTATSSKAGPSRRKTSAETVKDTMSAARAEVCRREGSGMINARVEIDLTDDHNPRETIDLTGDD